MWPTNKLVTEISQIIQARDADPLRRRRLLCCRNSGVLVRALSARCSRLPVCGQRRDDAKRNGARHTRRAPATVIREGGESACRSERQAVLRVDDLDQVVRDL